MAVNVRLQTVGVWLQSLVCRHLIDPVVQQQNVAKRLLKPTVQLIDGASDR